MIVNCLWSSLGVGGHILRCLRRGLRSATRVDTDDEEEEGDTKDGDGSGSAST